MKKILSLVLAVALVLTLSCAALAEVSLPEGLSQIGQEAFAGCAALEAVELPPSAQRFGIGAFSGCAAGAVFFTSSLMG